jgi:hypothetical protein
MPPRKPRKAPETLADIPQTVRETGQVIAQEGGVAYRVNCYRQAGCGLSEWHTSLAWAMEAFLDHQQRPWRSVALVPQLPQVPPQQQLGLW